MSDAFEKLCQFAVGAFNKMLKAANLHNSQQTDNNRGDPMLIAVDQQHKQKKICCNQDYPDKNPKPEFLKAHVFLFCGTMKPW